MDINKVFSYIVSAVFLYIVFVILYSIFLSINPNVTRPTGFYWPQFINQWLGRGPQSFSVAYGNVAIRSDLQYYLKNVKPTDCMSNCNASNVCIGFTMTGNTCNTFTLLSALYPLNTGSNVYVMDGTPVQTYTQYINQNVSSATSFSTYTARSNQLSDILYDSLDCATNCASTSTCLGFTMNGFSCVQQSGPMTLNQAGGQTTYVLGSTQLSSIGTPYASRIFP